MLVQSIAIFSDYYGDCIHVFCYLYSHFLFLSGRLHLDSESSVDNGVDGLSNYVLGRRIKMEADDEVTTVFVQGADEDGKNITVLKLLVINYISVIYYS